LNARTARLLIISVTLASSELPCALWTLFRSRACCVDAILRFRISVLQTPSTSA